MTSAPLFKTPTCTPPKNPSTPLSMMTTTTLEDEPMASTPTNHVCRCTEQSFASEKNSNRCSKCGHHLRPTLPDASLTPITSAVDANSMTKSMADNGGPLCK